MEYLGAWGTLIYEKKLRSKISCQTPFNEGREIPSPLSNVEKKLKSSLSMANLVTKQ